ncbi:MAG: thioesterase family protein [Rhodospirillaceae bacterium]|nr:thioesterase family protein [Rhodospirillaceae bacterium]
MSPPDAPPSDIPAPFVCTGLSVLPEWIDVNGHMNVARYVEVFDRAFDEVYTALGMSFRSLVRSGVSTFTAEVHITYRRELRLGEPLRVTTQMIGFDDRRLHFFQSLYQDEARALAATGEWLLLHVDMASRRAAPMAPWMKERFERVRQAHAALPRPPLLGRGISLANRRPD